MFAKSFGFATFCVPPDLSYLRFAQVGCKRTTKCTRLDIAVKEAARRVNRVLGYNLGEAALEFGIEPHRRLDSEGAVAEPPPSPPSHHAARWRGQGKGSRPQPVVVAEAPTGLMAGVVPAARGRLVWRITDSPH